MKSIDKGVSQGSIICFLWKIFTKSIGNICILIFWLSNANEKKSLNALAIWKIGRSRRHLC